MAATAALVVLGAVFLVRACQCPRRPPPPPPFSESLCREWIWHNPLPQGNNLYAVWGSARDDVIAVGSRGTIIRWNGSSWRSEISGTRLDLADVWGSARDDVWAVGEGGTVVHYDGSRWIDGPSWNAHVTGVHGRGPGEVWAVSLGDLLRLDGNTWTTIHSNPGSENLTDVWVGPSSVFASGSQGTVFRFDGTAVTTQSVAPGTILQAIWGRADDDVWVGGVNGVLLHFDGSSWTQVPSGTGMDLFDLTGADGRVYAVGAVNTVLEFDGNWSAIGGWPPPAGYLAPAAAWAASAGELFVVGAFGFAARWDGAAWQQDVGLDPWALLHDVWGLAPDEVYAVGHDRVLWRYDGTRWSRAATAPSVVASMAFYGVWGIADQLWLAMSSGVYHRVGGVWSSASIPLVPGRGSPTWSAIWGSAANDVFAVSDDGKLAHFDGTSWSSQALADTTLRDVWGRSASDVFVVGDGGTILHFDGATWSAQTSATLSDLYEVHGAAGSVFAVGAGGTILVNRGAGWKVMSSGITSDLYGVWARNDDDAIAVGAGVTLQLDATGWTTRPNPTPRRLEAVWGSGREVFAVGWRGTIFAADLCAGVQVTVGERHACGLRLNGSVVCWGDDTYGQASPPSGTFVDLSAGTFHTCGVRPAGAIECWGSDAWGQVSGDPPDFDHVVAHDRQKELFLQVSAGDRYTCGLRDDRRAVCWGYDDVWGKASGLPDTSLPSCAADLASERFARIAAGMDHTCGIRPDGSLRCWGMDLYVGSGGPWPDLTGVCSRVPEEPMRAVDLDYSRTCGLATNHMLICWGNHVFLDGSLDYITPAPVGSLFRSIGLGREHGCGVSPFFAPSCWGRTLEGQTTAPVGIAFRSVAAGGDTSCGVSVGDAIVCWGDDSHGQASPPPVFP